MTANELIAIVNDSIKEIVKQSSLSKLPIITMKQRNEISRIADFFGYFYIDLPSDISDEEKINMLLDKLTEYMTSDENIEYIAQLEKLCGSFAIEINNSYDTLSGSVKSIVDDIRDKIQERFEVVLKRENAENLISEMALPDTSVFSFLKWSGLSSAVINDENVIDLVTDVCNLSNKDLTQINVKMSMGKIIRPSFVEIPGDVFKNNEEIITEYFSKNYANINADDAKRYFKILLNKYDYLDFFNVTVKNSFEDMRTTVLNIQKILFDCNNMLDCYDAILKFIKLELSESSLTTLTNNIKAVRESCYITLFHCLYLKKNVFKGKLILSKTLINETEYKKLEKKGLDLIYISNYLKAYYHSLPIPIFGINTEVVLETENRLKEDITKINNKIQLDKNIIFSKCLHNAFKYTLENSFKTIFDTLGFDDVEEEFKFKMQNNYFHLTKNSASELNGDMGKVDDKLYNIIMSVFYRKSIVATMHSFINKNFIVLMSDKTTIDEKDVTEYTLTSIIEVMTTFLSQYIKK